MGDLLKFSKRPTIRCLALVILLTGSTHLEPLVSAIYDPDLWWHLRDGDAIIAQHAVPHHGVFSQYVNLPWAAYSWGFEVIVSRFYHWFGLAGFVAESIAEKSPFRFAVVGTYSLLVALVS